MLLVIEKAMSISVEFNSRFWDHPECSQSARTSRSSGQVAFEELEDLGVARAAARFRALPDDARIAFQGDQSVAGVGPILKLLDAHVIAGLAASTAGEECARYIDHVRRALALVKQWRTTSAAE